ncbi:MAG: hypothetical protein BVN35_20900 [Proteobacteria bacterium ST_bin11]|nr:MAG: hypothetical protein BVN35_20900 [Proteobacteria bacterium ST_bin11]
MKFLENILLKTGFVGQLFRDDLQERASERQLCVAKIEPLARQLKDLATDKLAEAEKEVADARLNLELAQLKYNDLATSIENQRRRIMAAIQAEEQKLQQMKPLILQQVVNTLHERVQAAGPLTPKKMGQLNGIFEELRVLPLVVDDERLLSCVADIDGRIQAIFS